MGHVPSLNSKAEKGAKNGVVVIGVTDESPELVEQWLRKSKATYPIVSLANGSQFEDFLGVEYFPYAAVIDTEGNVSYSGSAGMADGALKDAASDAKGPVWPKKLDKVTKYMMSDSSKAYAELLKVSEDDGLDDDERAAVEKFKAYLEGRAVSALSEGRARAGEGNVYLAVLALEPFAESEPPFPATPEIAKELEALQSLPDFKKEMKGGETYAEAEASVLAYEFTDAFDAFKSISRKYKGTKIGELSLARATELMQEGKPGYRRLCDDCRRGKGPACEKHAEKVKL